MAGRGEESQTPVGSYKATGMVAERPGDRPTAKDVADIIDEFADSIEMRDSLNEWLKDPETSKILKSVVAQCVNDQMERHLTLTRDIIAEASRAGTDGPKKMPFNERRAEKLNVPEYAGKADKMGFIAFAELVQNWSQALFKDAIKHMKAVEDKSTDPDKYVKEAEDESVKEFAERLYEKLTSSA